MAPLREPGPWLIVNGLMNVFFVVPYVPSLIRTRPYNLIGELTRQGHRVTLVTLWTTEQERRDAAQLEAQAITVRMARLPQWLSLTNSLRALPGPLPLQAEYCWQPALLPVLQAAAPQADVIHVEHLRGVKYGLHLKQWLRHHNHSIPIIWDSVDCISLLFRLAAGHSRSWFGRWVTRFELARTQRFEGEMVRQFDEVLVTSAIDRQALLELAGAQAETAPVSVLPNGVDVDYFSPGSHERQPATVVFSGKMSYHANVTMVLHLAQRIMPLVWAKRPEAKLVVVGKDPPPAILHLAQGRNVEVTGTVNDLRPYLQRATLAAVPLVYGAGSQFKVLEAMACATPVVATPHAAAPLQAQAGRELLLAQEPEAFAAHILTLMGDPAQQRRLGQAGRRYVEKHHAWDRVAQQLAEVYQAAQARHQRTPSSTLV